MLTFWTSFKKSHLDVNETLALALTMALARHWPKDVAKKCFWEFGFLGFRLLRFPLLLGLFNAFLLVYNREDFISGELNPETPLKYTHGLPPAMPSVILLTLCLLHVWRWETVWVHLLCSLWSCPPWALPIPSFQRDLQRIKFRLYLEGRQCVEFYGHPMTYIYNVLISELNYCEEVGSLNPVSGKPKVRLWYFWSR